MQIRPKTLTLLPLLVLLNCGGSAPEAETEPIVIVTSDGPDAGPTADSGIDEQNPDGGDVQGCVPNVQSTQLGDTLVTGVSAFMSNGQLFLSWADDDSIKAGAWQDGDFVEGPVTVGTWRPSTFQSTSYFGSGATSIAVQDGDVVVAYQSAIVGRELDHEPRDQWVVMSAVLDETLRPTQRAAQLSPSMFGSRIAEAVQPRVMFSDRGPQVVWQDFRREDPTRSGQVRRRWGIYHAPAAGGSSTQTTQGIASPGSAGYDVDGMRIAVVTHRDGDARVPTTYTLQNPEGQRLVLASPDNVRDVAVSGNRIAWLDRGGSVYAATNGDVELLSHAPAQAEAQDLAFVRGGDTQPLVWLEGDATQLKNVAVSAVDSGQLTRTAVDLPTDDGWAARILAAAPLAEGYQVVIARTIGERTMLDLVELCTIDDEEPRHLVEYLDSPAPFMLAARDSYRTALDVQTEGVIAHAHLSVDGNISQYHTFEVSHGGVTATASGAGSLILPEFVGLDAVGAWDFVANSEGLGTNIQSWSIRLVLERP